MIEIIPLPNFPIVQIGNDITTLILLTLEKENITLNSSDVIVIAHSIVSRAEGCMVDLNTIKPSPIAEHIATLTDKDPRTVEMILQEARSIVRLVPPHIITETSHGYICANSGVDRSNSPGETLTLLPRNPDQSARLIREEIYTKTGKKVAVIISDTFGRPFREGTTNVAIGVAGMNPLLDQRGVTDFFGYQLQSTIIARADEIAGAAGLIQGQAGEGIPVVIVRGVNFVLSENLGAFSLVRPHEKDIFR
ncbi:MAG: coenzyme F420-0:L-glutamate ligase [Promethearchaeota archaeon]